MGNNNYLHVILGVLSDWKVIVTVVVMLLVIEFTKFVANYKKRPPKPKVKKAKTPSAAKKPKKTEAKSEEEETEGPAEKKAN